MRNSPTPPVYAQVAYDIATRIAAGEIPEGSKFSGRSLTSSKYGVSSETIRRAYNILADTGIITIRPNVGAVVVSQEKASEFLQQFETGRDLRALRQELRTLRSQRDAINERINAIVEQIADLSERFRGSDPIRNYEFELQEDSPLIGQSVRQSAFWQKTEGTIVAIVRSGQIILSPGPDAVFAAHDILVVAGMFGLQQRVRAVIEPHADEPEF
nr:TrkA C-terminal domain-containing protein [Maliibacterium massiliense]